MSKRVWNKGVSVVEALVGSAILALVLFAFTSSLSIYSAASHDATKRTQAAFLADEALEVVRAMRDQSWSQITAQEADTPYGLSFSESNSKWAFTEEETVGDFNRTVTLGSVWRGSNDKVTFDSGGTYDDGTRLVTVEVSWSSRRGEQSVKLESLVTNAFEN